MKAILSRGPVFGALLLSLPALVFVASLFVDVRQTVAQVSDLYILRPLLQLLGLRFHSRPVSPQTVTLQHL